MDHETLLAVLLATSLALTTPQAPVEGSPTTPSVSVERETVLMGTRLRVTVSARSSEVGISAIESVFREVERLEGVLSSWRSDSELARLNTAAPGVPVKLSGELGDLLVEVRAWAARSQGAFEPAVGALIDVWDLRGRGRIPTRSELETARSLVGDDAFQLDAGGRWVIRRREGSWMSAGGFGKGAALRAARRVLDAAGVESALLDFGGQLLAMGGEGSGHGWRVAVAHPGHRLEPAAWILLDRASVATSAASERFVEIDGERFGHILDPRTGWPVPAWGSVTVVARDPLLADLASTTLFVLGPDAAVACAAPWNGVGVLVLDHRDGEVEAKWNRAMDRWLVDSTDKRGG